MEMANAMAAAHVGGPPRGAGNSTAVGFATAAIAGRFFFVRGAIVVAIKKPRGFGPRGVMSRSGRTDPQGLRCAQIITMLPTMPVGAMNGLVIVANMGSPMGEKLASLCKDSGQFGFRQVATTSVPTLTMEKHSRRRVALQFDSALTIPLFGPPPLVVRVQPLPPLGRINRPARIHNNEVARPKQLAQIEPNSAPRHQTTIDEGKLEIGAFGANELAEHATTASASQRLRRNEPSPVPSLEARGSAAQ
jgi:hypothetical protein